MGGRGTARRRSQTRIEENHTARHDEKIGYLATSSSGRNRRVRRGTGGCSSLNDRVLDLRFLPQSSLSLRQLTARSWCVQKRSRRVFFSTLPELLLGKSVSENSTRLGSL